MPTGSGAAVRLHYLKLRDVSTKEEEQNDASTYIAIVNSTEILKLGTSGNLRDYIPEHPGRKRSMVHKQIGATIRKQPERFSQFNSGFLVGASRIKVDDQGKTVSLWEASINDGAQSQGEISLYRRQCEETGEEPHEFPVRLEISVEPDSAMRTEIAIARNTATKIQDLSRFGKRGYFDDLNTAFQREHPTLKLATSETDLGDEFVNTRFLLQLLRVLMPAALVPPPGSIEGRMRGYKNAALCLADFQQTFLGKESDEEEDKRYQYYCNMAGTAWELYQHWKANPAWDGLYLRTDAKQVERENGQIIDVADGIIFPVLAALSNFVKRKSGRWQFSPPSVFKDEDLAGAARQLLSQYTAPMLMGRSGTVYQSLMLLTEMANRYSGK